MKNLVAFGMCLAVFCTVQPARVNAQFGDILKKAQESLGGAALSDSEIIRGLKDALQVGTGRAVTTVSQEGGYYDNPKIRIPLPGAVQKVETLLRAAGYGTQVDAFELSMNRAAERAAPEAKAIFWDAIKQMTFSDARRILNGRDNEATLYFEDKTEPRLQQIFKPIVHDSMAAVGVTRQFQELNDRVNTIPFAGSLSFDLDRYVTGKALDGLFYMLAKEEEKIRRNPAARTTEILKKVFGQ
jgi:hypothetical protein